MASLGRIMYRKAKKKKGEIVAKETIASGARAHQAARNRNQE